MIIGGRDFDTLGKCHIMGILNVTPDSFSDGGQWGELDQALWHAEDMIKCGADIIDVGGESTRPGFVQISASREIDRTVPVIEALVSRFDVPVSIDTYKAEVADAALGAGAALLNDIWGFKHTSEMPKIVKKHGVACCLMHNRDNMNYGDFMTDLLSDLRETLNIARSAGIPDDKIILDPGVGFAKTYEHNLEVINKLDMLKELGCPVLLGASRKSVIGLTLDLPVTQRVEGTLVTAVVGIMRGCSFVRVHDVLETKRAVMMTEAIVCN